MGNRLVQASVLVAVGSYAALYVAFGDAHADIGIYHQYALAFLNATGISRPLPAEYPPLALLPFSLTLIPLDGVDFAAVFVAAMAAMFFASCVVAGRMSTRSAATAYVVYMLCAGPWTLVGRFDLVPSLVVLAAVVLAERRRWRPAYVVLALGVLLKLYPVFLLPLFVIDQRRHAGGRGFIGPPAIFGLVVGAGFAAAAIVAPGGWLSPFRYALQRPVEIESVPATLLWVVSGFGVPGRLEHSYNSLNLIAAGSGIVAAASGVALVVGCLIVYRRHATGDLGLRGACLACLCLVVATNKVLSAQYLIWMLPLVAFEVGLDPLWIGICILTFLIYPSLYVITGLSDGQRATAYEPGFLVTVATRNALLLLATWRAVRGPVGAPVVAPA
jgi:hypothetical protein